MTTQAYHHPNNKLPAIHASSQPSQQQERVLTLLLSNYLKPCSAEYGFSDIWQAQLGMSCSDAIHWLFEKDYLQTYTLAGSRLHTLAAKLLPGHNTPIEHIVITSAGRQALALLQHRLSKEKQIAGLALDQAFAKQDLAQAVHIIAQYNDRQPFPRPGLWNGASEPSAASKRAVEIILNDQPGFLKLPEINEEGLKALRFQAAEAALAGAVFFDRVGHIRKQFHPKGNAWLLKCLYTYGVRKAQKEHTTSLETTNPSVPAVYDNSRAPRSLGVAHSRTLTRNGVSDNGEMIGHALDAPRIINVPAQRLTSAFPDQSPRVRIPIRVKITFPYLLLALFFAVVGVYLVSQIVFETLEERFTNQLIETGKLSSDRMVLEERQRLEALRLLVNMDGMAAAILAGDAERLRKLALPVAVNSQEEAIEILDKRGISVLSLRHRTEGQAEDYRSTLGSDIFTKWDFVQRILRRQSDNGRDKFAGVVQAPWGNYFYVAGPVMDGDRLAGVILVGKSLNTLARQFRQDTLAQTTMYDANGIPFTSTLSAFDNGEHRLSAKQAAGILGRQDQDSTIRDLSIASVEYRELLGPWEIRGGEDIGIIGVALPKSFFVRTSQTSRVQIVALAFGSVFLVVITGFFLARRITQPLLNIVRASARVAQGDLDVQVKPGGNDEVSILAHSFNQMVAGLHEVTERRLREIELMQALERERELRELKSRFVSMVSHEFRTPLATILSSAQFLQNFGWDAPQQKRQKHFERIQLVVTNMTQLLEDVLFIGRSEAKRLEFNPVQVDLESYCRDIADELQTSASNTHTVQFECQGKPMETAIDPKLLRLALANLLSNAIKYSPDGGPVHFGLYRRNGYFVFRIADKGIGIPLKDQPRLFETFHRGANVAGISGTGLGLYVAKMAVELHDGRITFESKEGIGTTFMIAIPCAEPREAHQ